MSPSHKDKANGSSHHSSRESLQLAAGKRFCAPHFLAAALAVSAAAALFGWSGAATASELPASPSAPAALEAEAPATGTIQGTVADAKGGIPGFEIKLRLPDGSERKTASNPNGQFTFDRLAAGTYRLEARLEGFADTIEPEVVVRAGETVEIRIVPQLLPFGPVVTAVRSIVQ